MVAVTGMAETESEDGTLTISAARTAGEEAIKGDEGSTAELTMATALRRTEGRTTAGTLPVQCAVEEEEVMADMEEELHDAATSTIIPTGATSRFCSALGKSTAAICGGLGTRFQCSRAQRKDRGSQT